MENANLHKAHGMTGHPAWTRPDVPPLPFPVVVAALRWIDSMKFGYETAKMTREEANHELNRAIDAEVTAEQFRVLLAAAGIKAAWLPPAAGPAPEPKPAPPRRPLSYKAVMSAGFWLDSMRGSIERAILTREEVNAALSHTLGVDVDPDTFRELVSAAGLKPGWPDCRPPAKAPETPADPLAALAKAVRDTERLAEANRQAIEWNARKLADLIDKVNERLLEGLGGKAPGA